MLIKKNETEVMRDELMDYYIDIEKQYRLKHQNDFMKMAIIYLRERKTFDEAFEKQYLDDVDKMSSEVSRMVDGIASMNEAEIKHLYHKIFDRWHPLKP